MIVYSYKKMKKIMKNKCNFFKILWEKTVSIHLFFQKNFNEKLSETQLGNERKYFFIEKHAFQYTLLLTIFQKNSIIFFY